MNESRRRADTLKKLDRVMKALRREEPHRVPISDFFWGARAVSGPTYDHIVGLVREYGRYPLQVEEEAGA